VLIAESDLNDPRFVTPRDAGGIGLDAQWSDDFHHALFTVLCPDQKQGYYSDFGSLAQLAKALQHTFVYDGIYSDHRQRIHGRPPRGLSQHRFLGFIQDHDQVGNRAIGDRFGHIVGSERVKIAAALVLTSPFVPMLFQGEEWSASSPFQYFADHTDPELARAVSKGRTHEFAAFGWDPSSVPDPENPAAFENSKLNWDEIQQPEHAEILDWYRALIQLRRSTPSLNDGTPGNTCVTFDEQKKWMRIQRGNILVLCNLGPEHEFPLSPDASILLASQTIHEPGHGFITLPQDSIVILEASHHTEVSNP